MALVLDTAVAIHARDGDPEVLAKLAATSEPVFLSIITRVELEGGVYRDPANTAVRRARLDVMLGAIPVLPFDALAADAYSKIVAACGYSRRKLLDRMIAAQALVLKASLVTRNPTDFDDIPGLVVARW